MRAGHRWISKLFLIAVLCATLSSTNKTPSCEISIKVKRNTVYNATPGEELKIACPVNVCENNKTTIDWFKIDKRITKVNFSSRIKTEWERTNSNEGIHYLIFNKIFSNDFGQYQCQTGNEVSHTMIVTVRAVAGNITETSRNITNSTLPNGEKNNNNNQLWLYVFTAAGIVGFVIVVIVISVLSMRGCSGKPKNKTQRENQNMDIPMIEQPVHHHPNNPALPRTSPCGTPSHRASRKKKSPSAPPHANVYGQVEEQQNGPDEERNGVVYAALNHQHLAGASPRTRTVADERSEYAAIRVH